MRIIDVQTYLVRFEFEEPVGFSRGWGHAKTICLVKVLSDSGHYGWGEIGFGPPEAAQVVIHRNLKPFIVGNDPFDLRVIWERNYSLHRPSGQAGTIINAMSGVDIALWDLIGKATGRPVYKLLGGAFRHTLTAYASCIVYRKDETLDQLAERAQCFVARGYRHLKMKVGLLSPSEDVIRVETVRKAVGDSVAIMLDANCAYSTRTALEFARVVAPYNIYWFEEPVVPEDVDGYCELKARLDIPIVGGELSFTRYGFRQLIEKRAVDLIQVEPNTAGGLTAALEVATLCRAANLDCTAHVFLTDITRAAAAHFLAAQPDNPMVSNPSPLLFEDVNFSSSMEKFRRDLVDEPLNPVDGVLKVPERPGLGIDVNLEALRTYGITEAPETSWF